MEKKESNDEGERAKDNKDLLIVENEVKEIEDPVDKAELSVPEQCVDPVDKAELSVPEQCVDPPFVAEREVKEINDDRGSAGLPMDLPTRKDHTNEQLMEQPKIKRVTNASNRSTSGLWVRCSSFLRVFGPLLVGISVSVGMAYYMGISWTSFEAPSIDIQPSRSTSKGMLPSTLSLIMGDGYPMLCLMGNRLNSHVVSSLAISPDSRGFSRVVISWLRFLWLHFSNLSPSMQVLAIYITHCLSVITVWKALSLGLSGSVYLLNLLSSTLAEAMRSLYCHYYPSARPAPQLPLASDESPASYPTAEVTDSVYLLKLLSSTLAEAVRSLYCFYYPSARPAPPPPAPPLPLTSAESAASYPTTEGTDPESAPVSDGEKGRSEEET